MNFLKALHVKQKNCKVAIYMYEYIVYSGTPPHGHLFKNTSHLFTTTTLFCPSKSPIHFSYK